MVKLYKILIRNLSGILCFYEEILFWCLGWLVFIAIAFEVIGLDEILEDSDYSSDGENGGLELSFEEVSVWDWIEKGVVKGDRGEVRGKLAI